MDSASASQTAAPGVSLRPSVQCAVLRLLTQAAAPSIGLLESKSLKNLLVVGYTHPRHGQRLRTQSPPGDSGEVGWGCRKKISL